MHKLLIVVIALMARTVQAELSLEEIAYATGTDKSHDDHKYVDLYSSLFEPIRHKVTNITELGIASGQSLAMWAIFFANAHVWGLDVWVQTEVRRLAKSEPRLHTFEANAYKTPPAALGLMPNTMDIIIDDALHDQESIETALHAPVLRRAATTSSRISSGGGRASGPSSRGCGTPSVGAAATFICCRRR